MVDFALAHADLIQATHRGFTFLFANGLGWLGFPDYSPDNPLNRLGILLAFTPAVAIPAVLIAYVKFPLYMPATMAALLGGHFLPYSWLYQTDVYLVLGLVVALTPALLLWLFKEQGFVPGPLVVGVVLIVAAVILY
jgi:hypothetical protein